MHSVKQGPPSSQNNLEKEEKLLGTHTFKFIKYKATVINTEGYQHNAKYIDQRSRTESPKISPSTYGQLVFDNGENKERIVFSTNNAKETDFGEGSKG